MTEQTKEKRKKEVSRKTPKVSNNFINIQTFKTERLGQPKSQTLSMV